MGPQLADVGQFFPNEARAFYQVLEQGWFIVSAPGLKPSPLGE
jgi:hypothetical protein